MHIETALSGNSSPGRNLITKEAARILRISHRTLEDWRLTGGGPTFSKLGRRVVYRESDLMGFVQERLRRNTGQTGSH